MRLLAFLSAAVFVLPVGADNCRAVRQRVVVQHQAAVVAVKQAVIAPVAVAAFTPVVAVPQYSVGYDAQSGEVAELRKAIQELRLTIQALQQGTTQQQPQTNGLQAKATQIMAARCARCHNETTAKAEGGDFVLFRGGQLAGTLDTLDVIHVADRAWNGSMPPPKSGEPIPQEEAQVLRDWATSIVKAERAARKAQPQRQP